MTAQLTSRTLTRFAALLAVPVLAFAFSTSPADAHPRGARGHGHNYGHGHRHGSVVHVAAPAYVVRPCVTPLPVLAVPRVVIRRLAAPYRVYVPAPAVGAYPIPPAPYGSVVYDRDHGDVDGFIGFTGPHVSFGIAF